MQLSYWERDQLLQPTDHLVIGSGIVGLSCALHLRKKFPTHKIVVLEKGVLPEGASTKNAGFACFGSISEILSDLKSKSEEEVFQLVRQRWEGLKSLQQLVPTTQMDFQNLGGYELFLPNNSDIFENCKEKTTDINRLLEPLFHSAVFSWKKSPFTFDNIHPEMAFNPFESQIDTGKMMFALVQLCQQNQIQIRNQMTVLEWTEMNDKVEIATSIGNIQTSYLYVATNGFSGNWMDDVKPARAQVLITKPIPNLSIKGTFHLDEGFYYFRNIHNRILFGGGRNLDFVTETTTEISITDLIQNQLENYLKEIILPKTPFEIDQRWSGIMGVGQEKKPILKALSNRVYVGVRMGGMGVAIGASVGKTLSEFCN